jgi:hypothetical protein
MNGASDDWQNSNPLRFVAAEMVWLTTASAAIVQTVKQHGNHRANGMRQGDRSA